jgi:hypothetical protein
VYELLIRRINSTRNHQQTGKFVMHRSGWIYCTDLHPQKLRKALPGLTVSEHVKRPVLGLQQIGLYQHDKADDSETTQQIIEEVVDSAHSLTDTQLKSRVYQAPMIGLA